jgi:hypothetical protein
LRVHAVIQQWAVQCGVTPAAKDLMQPAVAGGPLPIWVHFLLRFDVRYRQRRVRFVVRAVNELYTRVSEPGFAGLRPENLDRVKAGLYDLLGLLRPITGFHSVVTAATEQEAPDRRAFRMVSATKTKTVMRDVVAAMEDPSLLLPAAAAAHFSARITEALDLIAEDLALEPHNARADALLVSLVGGEKPALVPAARRELLEHYIGFAVWDVLTFSITNWRDLDEFDEIRVDRLSPDDAQSLRKGGATATLKGTQFYHFGAFFSLAYRQNDYLWGRLHAAERLIDIVLDAAGLEGAGANIDVLALKKQAFRAILDTESRHLSHCGDLILQLRREVDGIAPASIAGS